MAVVLIAEDKPDIRELLRLLVEREGYAVVEASDGQEAVNQAVAVKPDLILLDLSMPVMDGLVVCHEIRGDVGIQSIPIVAVTAYQDKTQDAIDAGCNECVTKPVSIGLLHRILHDYIDCANL